MRTSVDITNKRFVIVGLQGSGKSEMAKYFLKNTRNSMVYDVHHEHSGCHRYLVEHKQVHAYKPNDPAIVELNTFVERIVRGSGQIRLFILEEGNRYCPNKRPLPSSILVLNDDQRHDRIAFGVVARRMTQLHTDLVELAHYMFIFRLVGKNDTAYLEAIAEGLGEAVKSLPDYHFCVVNPDRSYFVHAPIPIDTKKDTAPGGGKTIIEAKDMTKGQS